MNFIRQIYFYFIVLLLCTTIITIAGISGYIHLEKSIDEINHGNTKSLYYTEQMLSSLSSKKDIKLFEVNLNLAANNITENGEDEVINEIRNNYKEAFLDNPEAEFKTTEKIIQLSEINRQAVQSAVVNAEKIKTVGIWIIIFPTLLVWFFEIAVLRWIKSRYLMPLNELNDVITSYNKGNLMRRCPKIAPSKKFQQLYDGINNILDSK